MTFEGRLVAGTLMVAGIALLGVVTTSIASWFITNVRSTAAEAASRAEDELQDTTARLDAVLVELRTVSARLAALERDRQSRPSA